MAVINGTFSMLEGLCWSLIVWLVLCEYVYFYIWEYFQLSSDPQGRQKLARFNAHEFATLVIDILSDAKRRQQGSPLSGSKDNVELILKTISNQHSIESQDNDQPDYDSVASDEETDLEATASKAHRQKSLDSDLSDGPVTVQEFMEVKNALVASEAKIQQLMKVNNNLSDELRIMQKKVTCQ